MIIDEEESKISIGVTDEVGRPIEITVKPAKTHIGVDTILIKSTEGFMRVAIEKRALKKLVKSLVNIM